MADQEPPYELVASDHFENAVLDSDNADDVAKNWNDEIFAETMSGDLSPETKLRIVFNFGVKLQCDSARVFSRFFGLYAPKITDIDLSGVTQGQPRIVETRVFEILTESLLNVPLVNLTLADIEYPNESLRHILRVLWKKSLRSFTLRNSPLGPEEMGMVKLVLTSPLYDGGPKPCEQLTSLCISGTMGGDKGAKFIAAMLIDCVNLVELEFSDCNVGPTGSRALARALDQLAAKQHDEGSNNNLQRLLLQGSCFTSDTGGFDTLCGALREFKHLQFVNLHNCRISPWGTIKLRTSVFADRDDFDPEEDLLLPDVDGDQLANDPTQDVPREALGRLALN